MIPSFVRFHHLPLLSCTSFASHECRSCYVSISALPSRVSCSPTPSFTPSDVIDMSKERDWPANLGTHCPRSCTTRPHSPRAHRHAGLGQHQHCLHQTLSPRVPQVSSAPHPPAHKDRAAVAEHPLPRRYAGITVDPNFTNIQKLPRAYLNPARRVVHAFEVLKRLGNASRLRHFWQALRRSERSTRRVLGWHGDRRCCTWYASFVRAGRTRASLCHKAQESSASSDFKPTRRVRDPPGGRQHDIFGDVPDDDALSAAPPKPGAEVSVHPLQMRDPWS